MPTSNNPGAIDSSRPGAGTAFLRIRRLLEDNPRVLAAVLLAFMAILLAVVTASAARPGKQDVDHESMLIAADLLGIHTAEGWQLGAPGYPMIVAAVARADPRVEAAVACRANKVPCAAEASFATLIALQYTMAIVALVVALLLAYRLSGASETAILTLLLTFLGSRLGAWAGSASALIWIVSGTYLYLSLGLEAYRRASVALALSAGIMAAAVALLYPLAAIVPAVLAVTLFIALGRTRPSLRLAAPVALLCGAATVALAFHLAAPSAYDQNAAGRLLVLQLSERLGYQAMGFKDWLGSLVLPLPFLGGWLEFLFSEDTARRLAHGYAALGREEIFPRAVAESASPLAQYAWLVRTYIEQALGSYLAVTPGILNRGVWGGADIVALVGIFHIRRLLAYSAADGRCGALAMVLAPIAALLVVNTLFSANPAWANAAMPFVWAYAIAYVVARFPSSDATVAHSSAPGR